MRFRKLIKNILASFLKPKKINPLFFPIVWLISHNLNYLRIKINQFSLSRNDKKISKELQKNGFVTIKNFLDSSSFKILLKHIEEIKKDPKSNGWFESINISTSTQYRPLGEVKYQIISNINHYVARVSGQPKYAIRNILDIQSGGLDGNCEFHSDIYRPTYKAWLYIKDVENFPFEFISGTSGNNWNNFIFHMFCQTKYFLNSFKYFLSFNKNKINKVSGSWRLDYFPFQNSSINKFENYKINTFNVPANTLLIANTHGIHRRSLIGNSNNPREALMIDFRTLIF